MYRIASIIGLASIFVGPNALASEWENSTDAMVEMLKSIEKIFEDKTTKPRKEDIKAYEALLRKALEDAILSASAYHFAEGMDDQTMREILNHPVRKLDDKIEFASDVLLEAAQSELDKQPEEERNPKR
jgi:hypothetical protein